MDAGFKKVTSQREKNQQLNEEEGFTEWEGRDERGGDAMGGTVGETTGRTSSKGLRVKFRWGKSPKIRIGRISVRKLWKLQHIEKETRGGPAIDGVKGKGREPCVKGSETEGLEKRVIQSKGRNKDN